MPTQIGRYQVIAELGRGAMGIVYKARDPLIERVVAIKTVGTGLSREETETFERRFYREAKSAGRLNHTNIVTIYDVGKSDNSAYIAMELLEGQSLRDIIDSGAVLPIDKIADITAQVADGLAFAHQNDVVHRDIKPANIMVLDNGTVKIMDFGIALLPTGSYTLAGAVFGSPKYMSPEQVVGRDVDGRSDIFSVGAVLYEMLTGVAPFSGDDLNATLYQVINEMPIPPSNRNRNIPVGFDRIIERTMAKHPDNRYANAQELAADLRSYKNLVSPQNLPQSPPPGPTLERRAARRSVGDATVQLDLVPTDSPIYGVKSAEETPSTGFWQRRRIFLFGVPTLLIAVLAGGALFYKRRSEPSQGESEGVDPMVPGSSTRPNVRPGVKPISRVIFDIVPRGEIYVDGTKQGTSPPMRMLELPPGKHVIEIRRAGFPSYTETVFLGPRATVTIKHKF